MNENSAHELNQILFRIFKDARLVAIRYDAIFTLTFETTEFEREKKNDYMNAWELEILSYFWLNASTVWRANFRALRDAQKIRLNPKLCYQLGELGQLFGGYVRTASMLQSGTLEMQFGNDAKLSILGSQALFDKCWAITRLKTDYQRGDIHITCNDTGKVETNVDLFET